MMSYFHANSNSNNSPRCKNVAAPAQLGDEGSVRYAPVHVEESLNNFVVLVTV